MTSAIEGAFFLGEEMVYRSWMQGIFKLLMNRNRIESTKIELQEAVLHERKQREGRQTAIPTFDGSYSLLPWTSRFRPAE